MEAGSRLIVPKLATQFAGMAVVFALVLFLPRERWPGRPPGYFSG